MYGWFHFTIDNSEVAFEAHQISQLFLKSNKTGVSYLYLLNLVPLRVL